jgi:pilus assembly protein CpaF
MVNVSLTEKGGNTNELSFDKDEVTVGRVRGNDVVLPKGNVSKHHCRLLVRGGETLVEDLRSTNGTYVNGRKIAEPTPIGLSDKVFVGDFILRLTSLASAMESLHAPQGPAEAGSLSTAIPRRAPPAPPALRSSIFDDPSESGPKIPAAPLGHSPLPPPPPPPEPTPFPAFSTPFPPPSGPSDIDLDDEDDVPPRPLFNVPPLKPAVQPTGSLAGLETPDGSAAMITPPPAPSAVDADDLAPPEPPAATDDDVVEPPTYMPEGPSKRLETIQAAPSIQKAMPGSAKQVSRLLDRDLPEWLAHLLESDGVTAAFFTGTNLAEIQRNGRRDSVTVSPSDLAGLGSAIRKLASKGWPKPAPDATAIDTTLPDSMRISAVFPPVADRLCVAIRRPVASGKTIDDLVEERVVSPEMRQVLEACVASRQNILVAGDRAACDSLMRAILWSVDRVARVVLISDSIAAPASATSWIKLQPGSQTADLISAAVAMQPEYLVVDANQSALSPEVLSECNLGLEGVIFAIVARSANDALHRLQLLCGGHGTVSTIGADIVVSGIDVLVHATLLADSSLKVVEIAEPKTSLDGQVSAHALLTWIPGNDDAGSFTVTGAHSSLATKLSAAGNALPTEILNRQ